jgi:hypothetical protein
MHHTSANFFSTFVPVFGLGAFQLPATYTYFLVVTLFLRRCHVSTFENPFLFSPLYFSLWVGCEFSYVNEPFGDRCLGKVVAHEKSKGGRSLIISNLFFFTMRGRRQGGKGFFCMVSLSLLHSSFADSKTLYFYAEMARLRWGNSGI